MPSALKPKTQQLLKSLSEDSSRASLIALWEDLSSLTRLEFEAELDLAAGKKTKATKPARKPKAPPNLKPTSQIAFVLRSEKGLSDDVAQRRLAQALLIAGVPPGYIPQPGSGPLEDWLDKLLIEVSSSIAYVKAQSL